MRGYPYANGIAVTHPGGVWGACAVWPESSDDSMGTDRTQVRRWKVVAPFDAVVRRGHRLGFSGAEWVVSEDPEPYRSPFTGWAPGTVVTVTPAFTAAELDGHRDLVAASLLDHIVIERPTASGFDPATGRTTFTYATIYDGPADIAPASTASPTVDAGEVTTMQTRTVTTEPDVAAMDGDRLTVAATAHTPALVGAVWWVSSVDAASSPDRTTITVRMQR